MKNVRLCIACIFVLSFILGACSAPATPVPTETAEPVPDTATPVPDTATPVPTKTVKPTDVPSPTTEPTATIEPSPTVEPSPTIEPTRESAEMEKLIQQLADDHVIQSTDGTYHRLDDFEEAWAQLYYYQWWYTDFSPTNFVIQADMEWESASRTANFGDSGCGFVYHTDDASNHHATFLMMDGHVQTFRALDNNWLPLKGGYAGRMDVPKGKAHYVLVVENQKVTVFINGKKAVSFEDTKLQGGKLGYTLASGTNKDFGTRCMMTNVELWELLD